MEMQELSRLLDHEEALREFMIAKQKPRNEDKSIRQRQRVRNKPSRQTQRARDKRLVTSPYNKTKMKDERQDSTKTEERRQ